MIENFFVLSIMLFSGGYIAKRLWRMTQASRRRQSACGSCSSGTCSPESAQAGETQLPLSS